jgi:hypothetical protein
MPHPQNALRARPANAPTGCLESIPEISWAWEIDRFGPCIK